MSELQPSKKSVFICYSLADQRPHEWMRRLKIHLGALQSHYNFDLWEDSRIKPGEKWRGAIQGALGSCSAAVLLVGPGFLVSQFINEVELPELLRRAEHEGLPLLILITGHCNFENSPLANFQAHRDSHHGLDPLEKLSVDEQNRRLRDFSISVSEALARRDSEQLSPRADRSGVVRHNLPIRPLIVIGRTKDLRSIDSALRSGPVIAITGFAGVGKSTVAKASAWKFVEKRGPFQFVAWVDMRRYGRLKDAEAITLESVLDSIALAYDHKSDIPSIGDAHVKAARVRELLAETRSLLVLDNYEDLLSSPQEEAIVVGFVNSLPVSSKSRKGHPLTRVLVTTRLVTSQFSLLPFRKHELESLTFSESLEMMKGRPGAPKLQRRQWEQVWRLLYGLPKYMQIAVEQLSTQAFSDWQERFKYFKWDPAKPDDFFYDLFGFSWQRSEMLSDELKLILLSMTYFVGRAGPQELLGTTGLSKERFYSALPLPQHGSYLEVLRFTSGKEYYSVHPLMHRFCQSALESDEHKEFKRESGKRFVKCFLEYSRRAHDEDDGQLIEDESQNIVAAARIALRLNLWEDLIAFREFTANHFRLRGRWQQYREIVEFAIEACRTLGNEELLAACLVYDAAWYYLRIEDVTKAKQLTEDGLAKFEKLKLPLGVAQAKRQLGKAALLDGLDSRYEPQADSAAHFKRAEQLYWESLNIRLALNQDGSQELAIADMKLDFGRLYWLQGKLCDIGGEVDLTSMGAAVKYEDALMVSCEALRSFMKLAPNSKIANSRVAKAWGNLGNALTGLSSNRAKVANWAEARKCARSAERCYARNAALGIEMGKRDEIAHGLAGIAELRVLCSDWEVTDPTADQLTEYWNKALGQANTAHRIYQEMAGPRSRAGDQTRDEVRTDQLIARIQVLRNSSDK